MLCITLLRKLPFSLSLCLLCMRSCSLDRVPSLPIHIILSISITNAQSQSKCCERKKVKTKKWINNIFYNLNWIVQQVKLLFSFIQLSSQIDLIVCCLVWSRRRYCTILYMMMMMMMTMVVVTYTWRKKSTSTSSFLYNKHNFPSIWLLRFSEVVDQRFSINAFQASEFEHLRGRIIVLVRKSTEGKWLVIRFLRNIEDLKVLGGRSWLVTLKKLLFLRSLKIWINPLMKPYKLHA